MRMGYPLSGEAMASTLGSIQVKEQELEAEKRAAMEKVKLLIGKQKELEQIKTDLLEQGLAQCRVNLSVIQEDYDEDAKIHSMVNNFYQLASPRPDRDKSPVS